MLTGKTSSRPFFARPHRHGALARIVGVGLCLLLSVPHASAAPETDPSGAEADARAVAHASQPSQSEPAARAAFEAGRAAYDHGRFAEALDQFELAYELSRLPQLLFNIARAAESDGRGERALRAYTAYLQALPDADNRDFVEARMRRLRSVEASRNAAPTAPPPSPRQAAALDTSAASDALSRAAPRRDEVDARPFYKRGWFWTVVGAGVVGAAVTGVVLATRKPSEPDSYDLSIRALRVPE